MTRDEIKKWMLESSGFPVTQANAEYLECFQAIAFKAGAASRDAEVAKLINAVADHVTARIELRAQINVLREAATPFTSPDVVDETSGTIPLMDALEKALSSTPEQSLAEYRNKVIDDVERYRWLRGYMASERTDLDDEIVEACSTDKPEKLDAFIDTAIRAMKE